MPRETVALSSLLSSNAVPKPCEIALVQVQIDQLTSQILQLVSQLEELNNQVRLHRAVLSPVRRLPAEILGEIYEFALPGDLLDEDERAQLVHLQLVCKTWRDAARLKHRLWSGLDVSLYSLKKLPLEKIELWFRRSGNMPRSLQILIPDHEDCESQDSPCRLHSLAVAALLAEGGPLSHFSFACSSSQCVQRLLSSLGEVDVPQPQRPWYSLKSIAIKLSDRWGELPDPTTSIFYHLPPNVTSFELHLPHKAFAFTNQGDSAATPLHIPSSFLQQLTSLSLISDWAGLKWLECTLPFCTNLETLVLDFDGVDWAYDTADGQIQQRLQSGFRLPTVRTLCLQNLFGLSIKILSCLRTPQLVELDIHFDNGAPDIEWELSEFVIPFTKQSNCTESLRCFRLRHARLEAGDLAEILLGLPFLAHLMLEGVDDKAKADSRDVFDLLRTNPRLSLRHLETLEILESNPTLHCSSLLHYLVTRRPFSMNNGKPMFFGPPDTIKNLTITYRPPDDETPRLGGSDVIQVLKKWCNVSVNIGPVTF